MMRITPGGPFDTEKDISPVIQENLNQLRGSIYSCFRRVSLEAAPHHWEEVGKNSILIYNEML